MAAAPETVWQLLTNPKTYDTWADARVEAVDPPGPARPGQVVRMSSGAMGLRFKVRFDVERVDEATHDLEFRAEFPFGIRMHEHITVRPVDGASRVQYG
ncbi:MAG TPA: SRPBCC family protein [Candidatus Dormibacteraeota bacterium]|nr:SRPBCC family protein [Candidatus Dormibacteraeota bacterium]